MNTDQMRYFSALYEHRNAQRAAESVFMSRQGLVKSLNSLEQELGAPLFDNKAARICAPTAYGETFKAFVESSTAARNALMREFDAIRAREDRTISCGISTGVVGLFGANMLKDYEVKHPDYAIEYDEVPDLDCDTMLKTGACSLALTIAPFDEAFETQPIYSTNRCIWVNTKDPLAHRESVTIEDLRDYEIGTVGRTFKNYEQLIGLCRLRDVQLNRIETFSEMTQLYRFAATPGHASFTVPHVSELFTDLFHGAQEPVATVPIEDLPWEVGISWNKEHEMRPFEQQFIDHCVKFAQKIGRV